MNILLVEEGILPIPLLEMEDKNHLHMKGR